MNKEVWPWLVLVAVLIILAAFFSAAEIGMMSINRYRLRHLVKSGHHAAKMVQYQINHPEKLLSSVLIGNTLANIFASMAMTFVGQKLYRETGVAIAEVILTILLLVFAEMTPKTWAALHPEKASFAVIYFLRLMQWFFWPLSYITTFMSNLLLSCLGVSTEQSVKDKLSYEELRILVNEVDNGLIPKEHQSMLMRLLDLEQGQVEDVMVPKGEIIGIDLSEPWVDILDQLKTIVHTRVPVYQHQIDNLLGVIHMRDIAQLALNDEVNVDQVSELLEDPIFIPAGTPLNVQILQFRVKKARSGFVVNEYGDLMGLVTLEDILEEVVGEFTTDVSDLYQEILPQEKGEYLIDASISLKQLHKVLAWEFPNLGARTLSGLIIEYLGYIPPADCCLRMFDYQITILRVKSQMIKSVRIKRMIA